MTKQQKKFQKKKDREREVRKKVLYKRSQLRKEAARAKYQQKLERAAAKGDAVAKAAIDAMERDKRMREESENSIFETSHAGFAPAPLSKKDYAVIEKSTKLQTVLEKIDTKTAESETTCD